MNTGTLKQIRHLGTYTVHKLALCFLRYCFQTNDCKSDVLLTLYYDTKLPCSYLKDTNLSVLFFWLPGLWNSTGLLFSAIRWYQHAKKIQLWNTGAEHSGFVACVQTPNSFQNSRQSQILSSKLQKVVRNPHVHSSFLPIR